MKVSYFQTLSGTSFRQDALKKVTKKTQLRLRHDAGNKYDQYAIACEGFIGGTWELLGWIPKGKNVDMCMWMGEGNSVELNEHQVNGGSEDKPTLGLTLGMTWGDDSATDTSKMESHSPHIGIGNIFFDPDTHTYYDEKGNQMWSGSRVDEFYKKDVSWEHIAKAVSKSTGVPSAFVTKVWENKGILAANLGTLVHDALDFYYSNQHTLKEWDKMKERKHSAKHHMPAFLGAIVDSFVKTSGIEAMRTEVLVRYENGVGRLDGLEENIDGTYTINDFKVKGEYKEANYEELGTHPEHTVQQNFYRQLCTNAGAEVTKLNIWHLSITSARDGDAKYSWKQHELPIIHVPTPSKRPSN